MAPPDAQPPAALDPRTLKAIAHPLRFEILARISEGETSPKEIATALGQPLGRVGHHVRTLARLGAIRLVRTERRRGAVEHFYVAARPAMLSAADWERLPPATREALVGDRLGRVLGDATLAARAGGFSDSWAHVSYTLFDLDAQGTRELSRLLEETLRAALEIRDASAERTAGAGARTELVMLHFRRPDGDEAAGPS